MAEDYFRATPRPDGGYSIQSAAGGGLEFDQVVETAAELVAACEVWTYERPVGAERQVGPTSAEAGGCPRLGCERDYRPAGSSSQEMANCPQ